jgi:hypothetical protein
MAKNTDIPQRVAVLALKAAGKPTTYIHEVIGIPISTINKILARAILRGFDPAKLPFDLRLEYIEDAPRPGRPTKQIPEIQTIVIDKVRLDRYGREKTCTNLAGELSDTGTDISRTTILRKNQFNKTKPTRKPGLMKTMKEKRLHDVLITKTGFLRIGRILHGQMKPLLL